MKHFRSNQRIILFLELNILRRRRKKIQQEKEAQRQAEFLAKAVDALGAAKAADEKKKSSSTSSSDLVTAGGIPNPNPNQTNPPDQ